MRVGIIGCGNISDIYATNAGLFRDIEMVACADVYPDAAQRIATKFGLKALSVDELLASKDIDIVLNLTIPSVHAEISIRALENGKHVYSEKPLATSLEDGERVIALAEEKGLRVGCAPDTILGPGLQQAKQLIDSGEIGQILSGVGAIMSKGMEHWHPNPSFFYQEGAGPVLDLGPYYISALVALLGPIRSVQATGLVSPLPRVHGAEGPKKGTTFPVTTFTSVNSILTFESGAHVSFMASWDVWRHGLQPIELFGTKASIRVPDPDTFGHPVEVSANNELLNSHNAADIERLKNRKPWEVIGTSHRAYGNINYPFGNPISANYRALGLAEMANAIVEGRPHRCSGQFALHVLAVMLGIIRAAQTGKAVELEIPCDIPAPLWAEDADRLLAVEHNLASA